MIIIWFVIALIFLIAYFFPYYFASDPVTHAKISGFILQIGSLPVFWFLIWKLKEMRNNYFKQMGVTIELPITITEIGTYPPNIFAGINTVNDLITHLDKTWFPNFKKNLIDEVESLINKKIKSVENQIEKKVDKITQVFEKESNKLFVQSLFASVLIFLGVSLSTFTVELSCIFRWLY